jgi:hypothetical protein
MTSHQHWDELAAGYALHALSAEEVAEFTAHLAGCDTCLGNVRDHELVAAQLGSISHYSDIDQPAPSWESIRAVVVGTPAAPAGVVDLAARRRRYETSRRALGAAAALVVVAGGGIVAWHLAGGSSPNCEPSDGCHMIHLDAAQGHSLAALTVRNDQVTVTPTDLPVAPAGKIYVLWQEGRNLQPTAISEFNADSGSLAAGALTVPYADTQQFAVSLENDATPPRAPTNTLASGLAG